MTMRTMMTIMTMMTMIKVMTIITIRTMMMTMIKIMPRILIVICFHLKGLMGLTIFGLGELVIGEFGGLGDFQLG